MRLRSLVSAVLAFLVVFVVGGNLYLRVQVKKTFDQQLSQWQERVNKGLPPGREVKVEVKGVSSSFTPMPFLYPSNPFEVVGLRVLSAKGEVTLKRLAGTAETSLGRVKGIRVTALEGLEGRYGEGVLTMGVRRVLFNPPLDVGRFFGWVKAPIREAGGRMEGLTLSFINKKGGELEISVKEATFKQNVNLGMRGEAPPAQPFKAQTTLKGTTVSFRELGDEKGVGEAFLDRVDLGYGLSRGKKETTYTFREEMKAKLSRLRLVLPPKDRNRNVTPEKLLPLKGGFKLELANLSEDLVASALELLETMQTQSLPQDQRISLVIQFLQRGLPSLMAALVQGEARLNFPQGSSFSARFRAGVMQLLTLKRGGNPVWVLLKVKNRDGLLALLSQSGIRDEKIRGFLAGLECRGDVCEKRVPIGGGGQRF